MNSGQDETIRRQHPQWLSLRRLAIVALVAASFLGGLVVSSSAKPGYVTTKKGDEIPGDIDDAAADTITVTSPDGHKIQLFKSNVTSVKYFASTQDEFNWRLSKLGTQDVPGRVALAKWAIGKGQHDLAEVAVASAKKIDPASAEVAALDKELNKTKPPAATAPVGPAPVGPAPAVVPAVGKPAAPVGPAKRVLTADEIQVVRAREMPQGDKTVKLHVPPTAKVAARDAGVITAAEFKTITLQELGQRILTSRETPPGLRAEVTMQSDPAPLTEFRTKVNKALVTSCATAACHGGNQGGNLYLFTEWQKEDQALTNFVILTKFEKKVDGVVRSMLDRTAPDASLLLAYMLPLEISPTPHPNVPNFKAVSRNKQEANYINATNWIGKSLIPVPAPYDDIDLTQAAPAAKPGAAPATPPKAGAAAVGR